MKTELLLLEVGVGVVVEFSFEITSIMKLVALVATVVSELSMSFTFTSKDILTRIIPLSSSLPCTLTLVILIDVSLTLLFNAVVCLPKVVVVVVAVALEMLVLDVVALPNPLAVVDTTCD